MLETEFWRFPLSTVCCLLSAAFSLSTVYCLLSTASAGGYQNHQGYFEYDQSEPLAVKTEQREAFDTYIQYTIRFDGFKGDSVDALLDVPRSPEGPFPLIVFLNGYGQGKGVIDLVGEQAATRGYAVATMDYPAVGSLKDTFRLFFKARGAARTAVINTRKLIDYLQNQKEIDSERIGLVGISLGAILAPIISAHDKRFDAVVLVHGGGDLQLLAKSKLTKPNPILRHLTLFFGKILYDRFEPLKYVGQIAPRPLLMINGRDDRSFPVACVLALYKEAKEPKHLIWRETKHIKAKDTSEIQALLEIALDWLDENL